jgi:cystathionine beta-lyase/cystathionine gamma-synthase
MGGVPGPFSCYLALRGVKTLHLRMREHEKNAFEVAKFLNSSPHVERVIYPGIRSLTSQLYDSSFALYFTVTITTIITIY